MTGLHIKRLLRSSQLIRLKRKSGNGKIHSVNLFSHKHTRPKEEGFILIFIMSAPFNTILRLAIRQTWLSILADNSAAAQDHPNMRAVKDLTNSSNTSLVQFFFVCGHGYQRVESAVGCQWDRNLRRHFKAEMYEKYWLLVHKDIDFFEVCLNNKITPTTQKVFLQIASVHHHPTLRKDHPRVLIYCLQT